MLDDSDINQIIEEGELMSETVKMLNISSVHGYDYQPDEINNPIYGLRGTREPLEAPFNGIVPWLEMHPDVTWLYWEDVAEEIAESEWKDSGFGDVSTTTYIRVEDISEIWEMEVPREVVEDV